MVTGVMVLVVIVLLVLGCIGIYSGLVKLRNSRENTLANIDVQLKQRIGLIPQSTGAVKGYAEHEKQVLQRITGVHAMGTGATTIDEEIKTDNALTQTLTGLCVSLEACPELKANQNFTQLQNEIANIENKLSAVRHYFNTATYEPNSVVQIFPSNFFASTFGFKREPMCEIIPEQRAEIEEVLEVKF